jgi:hypothetical protein
MADTSTAALRDRLLRDFRTIWAGRARRGPYQPRLSQSGKCIRALSYHRQGYPETHPMPAGAGLTFDLGDLLHAYLDRKLRELRYPLREFEQYVELRAPSGLVITGHFDRALGDTVILDYKSASDPSFRLMVDRNEPLADYVAQMTGYLEACRRTPGLERYTTGLFVVVNKGSRDRTDPHIEGTHLWISPPLSPRPELARQLIEKFEAVERHAREGTLPDRPYASPAEYPCRFCAWRGLCWGDRLPSAAAAPADLSALADAARAYHDLGQRIRALEAERERVGGQLRAALTDHSTRCGVAGAYEVALATQTRTSYNDALIPPDIRARARVATEVTQLRVRPAAPQAPIAGGSRQADRPPTPAPSKPAESGAPDAGGAAQAPAPARFLTCADDSVITHDDFLAFIGRAAAQEHPDRPDPRAWLARRGFPADLARLSPAQASRALAIAQRIIAPHLARQARRGG